MIDVYLSMIDHLMMFNEESLSLGHNYARVMFKPIILTKEDEGMIARLLKRTGTDDEN